VALKAGSTMALLPSVMATAVLDHPAHRINIENVARLMGLHRVRLTRGVEWFRPRLRAC
jgi:hypothetical protein